MVHCWLSQVEAHEFVPSDLCPVKLRIGVESNSEPVSTPMFSPDEVLSLVQNKFELFLIVPLVWAMDGDSMDRLAIVLSDGNGSDAGSTDERQFVMGEFAMNQDGSILTKG